MRKTAKTENTTSREITRREKEPNLNTTKGNPEMLNNKINSNSIE